MNFFSVRQGGQIFNSLSMLLSGEIWSSAVACQKVGWRLCKMVGNPTKQLGGGGPKIKHLAIAEATMINYLPCQGLQEENHRTASSKNELVL